MNTQRKRKRRVPACRLDGFTPEQLDAVDQLLSKYIDHACNARASASWAARRDFADCFTHNAQYWRNGVGILRWVRGHFRRSRAAYERRNAPPAAQPEGGT